LRNIKGKEKGRASIQRFKEAGDWAKALAIASLSAPFLAFNSLYGLHTLRADRAAGERQLGSAQSREKRWNRGF
jgi:hypothetical protein